MTGTRTSADAEAVTRWELARLRRAYRPLGWTLWYGKATGQYWAAHTRGMVLLCGDDAERLAAAIERFGRYRSAAVPEPRRGIAPVPQGWRALGGKLAHSASRSTAPLPQPLV